MMKFPINRALGLGCVVAMLTGCGDSNEPPPIKTMEEAEVAPAVESAFSEHVFTGADQAEAKQKELDEGVRQVVAAFNRGDYPTAMIQAEQISRIPDLTKQQRETLGTVMNTINQKLVEARAAGNQAATDFMEIRTKNK